MTIGKKPLTTVLIASSMFLAACIAGITVKAQIKKSIFVRETINPSAPCINGLFYPCWLTAKGATLVNPVADINDYYLNINALPVRPDVEPLAQIAPIDADWNEIHREIGRAHV
jgi:hypothetical protein